MNAIPNIKPFGSQAILLEWEKTINEKIHYQIMFVNAIICETFKDKIVETVPAFNSLAVFLKWDVEAKHFSEKVKKILIDKTFEYPEKKSLVVIPVCYEAPFSPDLKLLSQNYKIAVDEIIALHTASTYLVHFIGFLPGFPYLGGLNKRLGFPRKQEPRSFVPKGSVGIGGNQTGIYTVNSPGGWNIIGKCPLVFFDPKKNPPALIQAGDLVRFEQITKQGFEKIEQEVSKGKYRLKKQGLND